MKPTLDGTLVVLGISVATVAIATPVRYGAWIDPTAAIAVGGMTLNFGAGTMLPLLHVAKVVLIGALVPAWQKSRWAGILCAAVCAPLVLFSIWNTVAVLALQRSANAAEASAALERAASRRAELTSIGARLALVGWKPLATVEAEVAAERHHWMWAATSGCTKVTTGGERQFCARFARLEGARGAAIEAERLRDREAELRREMERQPVTLEGRQRYLDVLVDRLGISAGSAEIVDTLFLAALVDMVEIALFGFAGFFWSTAEVRASIQSASRRMEGARSDADRQLSPAASKISTRGRAVQCAVGADVGRRVHSDVQPPPVQRAAAGNEDERRRAVESFVATLSRGPTLRVTGSALADGYNRLREQHGWPILPLNVFGQLVRPAVEAAGGYKVKSSRQIYWGVGFPLG